MGQRSLCTALPRDACCSRLLTALLDPPTRFTGCVPCSPILQEKYIDGEVQERNASDGGQQEQQEEGGGGASKGQGGGAQEGDDEGGARGGDGAPEGYKWARGIGRGSRTGAEATT